MNPSEDLTLSKFCERMESDNNKLCITHRKLNPLILMIWAFFHRIIFLKNRFGFFSRVKSTTPRCHSSFYKVLLSLVVRHFWVSVILNSFIITCVVRHFNCPESNIRGHIVFALSVCLCQRLGRGHQCFTNASCSVLKSFCIRHFVFFILLFEWEYVSFMMISCIFWIGPRNSWVLYLNDAVHIYAN
jgi:hypothetical protein